MALTKPILNNVIPFDATKQSIFTFETSGNSSQIVGNTLTIQRNDNLSVVYKTQQSTFAYSHTLAANTLQNGVSYIATLKTIGANGEQSVASNAILFVCLAEPVFQLSNIPSNNTIVGNSYKFDLYYNQINGELLNSVEFNLYGISGELVSSSGIINDIQGVPTTISYLFSGFRNGSEYYIQGIGKTVRGMNVDTGRILIAVAYDEEQIYSKFQLTNNCKGGYIVIQSSIVGIDGVSNPSPPIYVGDNGVDLTGDNYWVEWNDGYSVSGDFIVKMWGSNFVPNTTVMNFQTEDGRTILVKYKTALLNEEKSSPLGGFRLGTDSLGVSSQLRNRAYVELYVYDDKLAYCGMSELIDKPEDLDQLLIMLKRINNIYQITLINRGAVA